MSKVHFVVYTTSAFECPWCVKVKELLNIYGFDFYEKDIHSNPRWKKEFIDKGFKKVPQVFFDDNLIGGHDVTKEWVRNKFFENYSEEKKRKIIKELEDIA